MSTLKRYNGTSWETIGGVVTGDTLPIGSEVDYDGASAPAGWEEISNDLVVDSIKTKNLFYGGFMQGSFMSDSGAETNVTTRVRSGYIELESGTYTVSVSNAGYGVVLYVFDTNNTYKGGESVVNWQSLPYTFTLSAKRRIRIAIKNADDTDILPSDVHDLMIEKNLTTTTYKPFENIGGLEYYLREETKIGVLFDGKPIYRKVINWGNVTTNNTLSGVLSNLDTLLSIRGTCYSSQYSQYYNIPNIHTNINDFYINALIINNTDLQLRYGNGFTSLSKVIIILEYTKTTD